MADFAPPSGPPPPKVPQGWKAVWNDQYKEWFYVNIYTKQSQWEKPESPVYPPGGGDGDAPPGGAPPAYNPANAQHLGPEKTGGSTGAAMFGSGAGSSHAPDTSSDEAYARKLQQEESARIGGAGGAQDRGESDAYYNSGASGAASYGQNYGGPSVSPGPGTQQSYAGAQDQGTQKKGFLGKLLGKKPSSQQGYGGYPQQQGYYQGHPHQQYGYPPQQGYAQGAYAQQRPQKHGMGAGGAAALGVGGGLLGGMLIGNAMDGGDDGGWGGDDGGGEYGGDGGGDFGGDGGGDFDGGGGEF